MAENLINNLDLPSDFSCGQPLYAEDLNKLKGAISTLMNIINNNDSSWRTDTQPINVSYDESTGKLTIGNDDYQLENPDNQSNGVQVQSGCPTNNVTGLAKGTIFKCTDGHVYIYTGNQKQKVTIGVVEYIGWFDLGEFNNNDNSEASYLHIAYAKSLTFNNDNPPHIVKWSNFTTATNTGTFYEWYGMCTTNSIEDPTLTISTYTENNPPDQSNYEAINKYKWNYVKGPDTNNKEYIYMLGTDRTKVPSIEQNKGYYKNSSGNFVYSTDNDVKQHNEFLPEVNLNGNSANDFYQDGSEHLHWYDDPPMSVSSTWKVLFWANRKKDSNGQWGNFGSVTIHNELSSSSVTNQSTSTKWIFGRFSNDSDAQQSIDNINSNSNTQSTTINSNPPTGWTVDNNSQGTGNLYMSYAYFSSTGNIIQQTNSSQQTFYWFGPFRIGSNGTTSSTGSDNDQYNYIYCRNNSSTAPNIPNASANWTNIISTIENQANKNKFINISDTSEISNTYVQNYWTDHPYGVSEDITYEWMIGCTKEDNDSYSYAFGPIIFSHYGERGMDGDGIEYIFRVMADGLAAPTFSENENNVQYHDNGRIGENGSVISSRVYTNSEDTNYQQDDFIPQNWHDEPQIISSSFPKQYVSIRKQDNGVWGPFSTPKLWSESNSSSSDSYTIDGGNTSFVIDDQTVDDNLIGIATINFITVTKGGSVMVPGATGDYYISVTNKSLPKYNNLDVLTEEISYANGKASVKLKLNPNVNLPNDYTFTPGLYTYDVEIYVKEGGVYKLVSTKVHKLTINSDVSIDGSIYRLYVLNDSLSFYYNDSNNQWTIQNSISPRIFAYKFRIGGTSEKVSTYKIIDDISNPGKIDGTIITSQNESTYFTNGIYIEVGSLINNVTNNNNELIFSNLSGVGYQVGGYQIGLYEKKENNIIPLEFHTIGCTKDGKNGVFDSSSALGYSFFIENQCSYLDDQINSDSALKTLTLSGIKVYCNGDDISTDNSISYLISSSSIPNSTTNVSFLEVVTDQNNKNNFYLRRKSGYSQQGTTNYNNANGYKLVPTDTNNNYYYTVTVTRSVNGTNITLGVVKFQIFVDENISSDGTSYKLYVENPILHYNSSGELQNRENFKISIYKVDNSGNQKLTLRLSSGENQVMFMNQLPASTNDGIFYIISNLPSTHNSNGTELTHPYIISSGDIVLSNDLTYISSSYNLSLYKGSTYEDGPESVQCLKDPTINIPQSIASAGKFYYYAGEWDPDEYYCLDNDYSIPYVSYGVDSNGKPKFYMLTSLPDGACENDNCCIGGRGENTDPSEIPNDNSDYWEEFESSKSYYMAEAYFGNFAKFGSGIISGDFMISTNGYIFDSTSNWPLDGHQYNDGTKYNNKLAYTYFDSSNPDGNNITDLTSVKFAPNWWVNLKTGAMGAAQNKFQVDQDSNLTITGNVTANSFNTDGKRGNRIEISGGLFNVFNSSGQIGLSIGWDTDGNPFIFLTNGKSGAELQAYKLTYSGVSDASANITSDDATSIKSLIGTSSNGTPSAATLHTGPSVTQYHLYSASKSNVTGAYASTDPSNPSSSNVTWQNARKNCDGKLFKTSTISSILGSSSSYLIDDGYYISSIEVTEETGNRFSRLLYYYSNGIGSTVGKVRYKASGSTWYYCDSSWNTLRVINGQNHSVQFHASDHLYDRDRSA